MSAEVILAAFLLLTVAAFLCGEMYGREQERRSAQRRVERLRRLYVGGMREW